MTPVAVPTHCAFCSSTEDLTTCDYPVWDFVRSTYGKLKVGDKVRRIVDKTGHPAARVIGLAFSTANGAPVLGKVTLRKSTGKEITREVYARSPVQVLRDTNCGALACEMHRCERGPGATFCAHHWRAMEAVSVPGFPGDTARLEVATYRNDGGPTPCLA